MYKILFLFLICLIVLNNGFSQTAPQDRTVDQILQSDQNLSIRGYGELTFNQQFEKDVRYNGELDVQRFVLFFGYRFNEKLQLITEVEMEHASELFVEQAFANYKINTALQFRGGLLLIPMGIINEYHEPTTFNGVERPTVAKVIAPTTWRELGLGISGLFLNTGLRYQLYLVNGMKSYDDGGVLRGQDGLRKGRQKGIQSILSHPNLSGKIEYFGSPNLKLGLAGYFGKTQSTLFDNLATEDQLATMQADSSVVGIAMLGVDARYQWRGMELRSALIYSSHSNTREYNSLTGKDFGSEMLGWYAEAAFDLLSLTEIKEKSALLPFIRYEKYNTHLSTDGIEKSDSFNQQEVTVGLTWRHGTAISFKTDLQFIKAKSGDRTKLYNLGIGFWF